MVARGSNIAAALLLSACLLPGPARANGTPPSYASIRDRYLALEGNESAQRYRDNYLSIIDAFVHYTDAFPDAPKAPDALYNAGHLAADLYLVSRVSGDLQRALSLFERLAHDYPKDNLADDALFLVGRLTLEHGGNRTDAYRDFAAVVSRYPGGDMAPRAKEMLRRLASYAPKQAPLPPKPAAPKVVAQTTSWQGRAPGAPATVQSVKAWSNASYTRVAIYLSGPVRFRKGEVPAAPGKGLPRRVYIDLKPAQLGDGVSKPVAVGDGLLKQVRTGQFGPNVVRVVLDLSTMRHARVFPMSGPNRIIIDLTGDTPAKVAKAAPRTASRAVQRANLARVKKMLAAGPAVPLAVQAGLKIHTVVVDAGHGGKDDGAVGPNGLKEKNVALSIAKMLGKKLEHYGLKVIYTRKDDTFVPLEERTAIANTKGADLFISIHCNAFVHPDRTGVSTYYLNITSNRYEMRLAARENATSERSVSDLRLILADLATKADTDESIHLASRIQEHTVHTLRRHYSRIHDLGVKSALFYVLLGAKMPAVLVETSFISNPREARRLATQRYREKLAEGIFEGIEAFLADRRAVALGSAGH